MRALTFFDFDSHSLRIIRERQQGCVSRYVRLDLYGGIILCGYGDFQGLGIGGLDSDGGGGLGRAFYGEGQGVVFP